MSSKPTLLARPGKIGAMELKNRLVMPAMCTNYTYQGHFTDQAVHYYGLRAKGGVGLIIIEASAIDYPIGRSVLNCACSDDRYIPTLRKLTDEIHRYGAKTVLQIMHSGRQTNASIAGGQPLSCSAMGGAQALYGDQPRVLTLEECKQIVTRFGEGALRAQKAGFDGVELHLAHGYLLSAFLSPALNNRTDEYGGLEGGIKFCSEIAHEVKRVCGKDFALLARINGDDYHPSGGLTHIDARMIAVALESAGVDCINISAGLRESDHNLHDQTCASPRGSWVYMAEGIKGAVKVPVMIAKRISEDMVEEILAKGQADFVCVGRPHITDPDYGNKLLAGKAEDILPCIWCAQGCFDVLWMLAPTTCLCNPAAGWSDERPLSDLEPASLKKKVMVVGGGPAGCEAALVAAKRGHEVTLYEKGSRLGGAFRTATLSPAKRELERLPSYFERALPKAGVKVVLNQEITPEEVARARPDVVVVAVGARPAIPEKIPGLDRPQVVTAEQVMAGEVPVGNQVAIWTCSDYCRYTCGLKEVAVEGDPTGVKSKSSYACRSGYAAVDAAEYLASQGKLVSIVTGRPGVVSGMGYTSRGYLMRRFYRANIRVCSDVKVKEVTDKGLRLEKAGIDFLLNADTVIVSVGSRSQRSLAQALEGKVKELYVVGDADKVRNAMKAIEAAYQVALKI